MASRIGMGYRREQVVDRFRHEANRLRSRGVDVGAFPQKQRDPEVQTLDQLAYAAELLAAANDRLDELKSEIAAAQDAAAGDAIRSSEDATPGGYGPLTVPMLRQEIAKRGIDVPAKAKKADLVALLEADDARGPEPPSGEGGAPGGEEPS